MAINRKLGPVITIIGGGSGPIPLDDASLRRTDNSIGITAVTDDGGHTREVRATYVGVSATGDLVNRMAIRIRGNDPFRGVFLHRSSVNGNKFSNFLLAGAQMEFDSLSEGIRVIESGLRDYHGRVIPVSDDNIHLRTYFSDGTYIDGEHLLDELKEGSPSIINVGFTEKLRIDGTNQYMLKSPTPNPEALQMIEEADVNIIAPGSIWGSTMAVLKIPGVADSLRKSKAPLVVVTNAVRGHDTKNWSASRFAKVISEVIDRKIDGLFINYPNHQLPVNYIQKGFQFVEADQEECRLYAEAVYKKPFTNVESIGDMPVIRHSGDMIFDILISDFNLTDRFKSA